jgi:hypothetical protein
MKKTWPHADFRRLEVLIREHRIFAELFSGV